MSDEEKCQRCGEGPDPDLRTLWMACWYAMEELKLPFDMPTLAEKPFYTLRVCKACRGSWMGAIKQWFNEPPVHNEVGSGIFVRRNGANVEITEEEWNRMNPDREPVRAPRGE